MNPLTLLFALMLFVFPARFGGGQGYSGGSSSSSGSSHSSSSGSSSSSSSDDDRSSSSSSTESNSGTAQPWIAPDFSELSIRGLAEYEIFLQLICIVTMLFFCVVFFQERRGIGAAFNAYGVVGAGAFGWGLFALSMGSAYGLLLLGIWLASSILSILCAARLARLDFLPFWKPSDPFHIPATPTPRSSLIRATPVDISTFPGYDQRLSVRIGAAWPKLQKAWGEQRLDPVRSFLSDGMQIRTQIQLDAIRRRGVRNVLEGATVHRVKTIDQAEGVRYTTCTVEIEASGRDADIELATGERRVNEGTPSFKEYWTFMKRSGVTAPALGLLEGNCPSCGTPLEIGSATICPSCRSKIKSGEFDWVLTEISQVASSRMAYANKVAADLIDRDPGFTVSGMEDHASMVFWKMVGSLASGGPAPSLGAYVSVDLLDTLAEASRRLAREEWFHLEPVVAAVELESLDQRTGFDLVEVRIRWQLGPKTRLSKPTQADPVSQGMASLFKAFDPKLANKFDPAQMLASGRDGLEEDRKSFLLFERRLGQETSDDRNLTTSHCPSCGGPETPETGAACTWCGCSLEEQAGAWRLVKVKPGHGKLGI
jgi:uncharacterized Zn finger protein (UPF0148 family)